MKRLFWSTTFFFFCALVIEAQEIPPIEIYSPKDYGAENQNWSIAQSKDNYIYVANNKGLLEFNGAKWQLYPSPNETIIRSVNVFDDYIYTGCSKDFGYWQRNEFGVLYYTSLSQKLQIKFLEEEEFWNIVNFDDYILFQSLKRIYIYSKSSESYSIIDSETTIYKMFKVNKSIYFQKTKDGLYKIEKGKPKLVSSHSIFKNNLLVNVFNHKGKLLIETENIGFYILENNSLKEWDVPVNKLLPESGVYRSTKLRDGSFVLGTRSNGILHLTADGEINYHINIKNGLGNNTIHSIFEDAENNIWLGLDNGVSRIDINSPITLWDEDSGLKGKTLTSVFKYKEIIYITNDFGVYYFDKVSNTFKLIEGINSTGWKMFVFFTPSGEEKLLAAVSGGVYEIKYNVATLIAGVGSSQNLYTSEIYPDRVFIGGGNGLKTIRYNQGEDIWIKEGAMPGFHHALIKTIVEKDSIFWAGTDHQGILKLTFENISSHDRLIIKTNITYDEKKGLPSASKNNVFKLKNNSFLKDELLVTTEDGAYTYSLKEDKMIPSTIFGERYRANKLAITNAYEADNGDIWLNLKDNKSNRDKVERAILQADGTYLIDSLSYRELNGRVAETTYTKGNIFWLPTGDGLFQYDMNFE